MKDIQSESDTRNISINKVGVKDLRYPISVLDKSNNSQKTIADVSMFVNLPHQFKGTHMSRFIKILNQHRGDITVKTIPTILHQMKERLHAESAHISLIFPYFLEKKAPVSGAPGMMEYISYFLGNSNHGDDFVLGVDVPVNSLCPCSKEISKYGAHNQRSMVSVRVRFNQFIWIEELIELIESSASSPLYSLLERTDEKLVTELSYENPAFVEDTVRAVAQKLLEEKRVTWFTAEVTNFESIHNHNVYAFIKQDKLNPTE